MHIYESMEDKWYSFWERTPLIGLIDKIDSVIPSFALFLITILCLILFSGMFLFFSNETNKMTFLILDSQGDPVTDSVIFAEINGEQLRERTNNDGEVTFTNLEYGKNLEINIELSKGKFNEVYDVEPEKYTTITLEKEIKLEPKERKVMFTNQYGLTVSEEIKMEFYCDNPNVEPSPKTTTSVNGQIEITEPVNCIRLNGKVISDKYESQTIALDTTTKTVSLSKEEPPKNKVQIKIRNNGLPADGTFNINLVGKKTYSKFDVGAETTLNVLPGSYSLSVSNPSGDYGVVTKTINVNGDSSEIIKVSKTIKGTVNVTVEDSGTGLMLEQATVTLKDNEGRAIESKKTDGNIISFVFTDLGEYKVSAKKVGGIEEGYFAKTIDLEVSGDADITLGLEKITTENAGKVSVIVIDQDNEPIANSKLIMKYVEDDTIVELNEEKNYSLTDINGYTEFLAGKIKGEVYITAFKYPFEGVSNTQKIDLQMLNEFTVEMQIGSTQIEINAVNEKGEEISGEAQLFLTDETEISGLISVEKGKGQVSIKAGRKTYVAVRSENKETYYSEPRFLWPNQKEVFNVTLEEEILEPSIDMIDIYNKEGATVKTLERGNKYYALMKIKTNQNYDEVLMHFRAGKKDLLENDYLEIDTIEGAGINREIRGTSFTEEYEKDTANLTDSLAKWVNASWSNSGKGTRIVKVNFRVKRNTPPNEELQFFWRGKFDDISVPVSNAKKELYSDVYSSNIYFEGEEAVCQENFCVMNEWLYDEDEELYVDSPFETEQIKHYTYHMQIVNNSNTDFGENKKRIALSLEMIPENTGARIIEYEIKDAKNEKSGGAITGLQDLEIGAFEKGMAIDITLTLEGYKEGTSVLKTKLKSEGRYVFTNQESFITPSEKDLIVSLNRTFIPAMLDSMIDIDVADSDGEPVGGANVLVLAKEPGFDEYEIDKEETDRLGNASVFSGAHLPQTKVILEISKQGYARQKIILNVKEDIVGFNPSNISIKLNTITKREEIKSVTIANESGKDLVISNVEMDFDGEGVLNEGALKSYLNSLKGKEITSETNTTMNIIRARLSNGITQETLLEPADITGNLIITFRVKDSTVVFSNLLPVKINVGSGAQTKAACILVSDAKQVKTTEQGRVMFYFELMNACESEGTGIDIDELYVKTSDEGGLAELTLQSTSSTVSGRAPIEGLDRKVYGKFRGGEKLLGTVTFVPEQKMVGKTINLPIEITGKFLGKTIATKPAQLDLQVNVLNLKECMSISSEASPVKYDGETTVTVDATKCLGQKIDVVLCRNNPGCSGGAEGKISLSKKQFNLENTSEEISVYSPTLPGSYGVGVWARVDSQGGFSYIGEVPVNFKAHDSKFFNLSKYEVNVIGEGQEDVILLTNNMLSQEVKVKADNCIWGVEEPDTDWMNVVSGALIGATLGHMLGGAFDFGTEEIGRDDSSSEPETTEGREMSSEIEGQLESEDFKGEGYLYEDDLGNIQMYDEPVDIDNLTYRGKITSSTTGDVTTYDYSGLGNNFTSQTASGAANGAVASIQSRGAITSGIWSFFNRNPKASNTQSASASEKQNKEEVEPPQYPSSTAKPKEKVPKVSFSPKVEKLSFINWGRGSFTLIGAIIGGVAAYMNQQEDCSDSYQTVPYQDFAIFLQGDKLSIATPTGEANKEHEIPSDAGPLQFSLNGITPKWDFSDADYSNVENVGIRFRNDNLNDPLPKYGTLTINSTTHKHGSAVLAVDSKSSTSKYDVMCNNPNFGGYWIGSESEAGSCSGVSEGTYSQKYHIRVISGEPENEEAYIDKATSCYNGVLTGATGEEALPRVKMNWDWQDVKIDDCDYRNKDYVYCDATQSMIALTKKLTELNKFLSQNPSINCPTDPAIEEARKEFNKINEIKQIVTDGFIGIKDIEINTIEDDSTATLTVENKTGEDKETYISSSWKGAGEPVSDLWQGTIPAGTSEIEFTATLPEYDDLYFFSAVVNGPKGNRRTLSRAFEHRPATTECWAEPTTRSTGGVPSITYYLSNEDNLLWTNEIQNGYDLLNSINFGMYLMRDSYSEDFLNDFKNYYLNTPFQIASEKEKAMLEWMSNDNFYVVKRFTEQATIEAGLYDIWLNIDFGEDFIINNANDTTVETSLLQVKSPGTSSPFYKMPFDGPIGESRREGYGAVFKNEDEEIELINGLYTTEGITSNGAITIDTRVEDSFEKLNSSIGSRGQLATISVNGASGDITLSPNIATPTIMKYTLNGTKGKASYKIQNSSYPIRTGTNLTYWTGAARSKSFYGGNAVEAYNKSADYLLDTGEEYGFEWDDVTHEGTLYLKTVFYSPPGYEHILIANTNNTEFWTPNNTMSSQVELTGIGGMNNNTSGNHVKSLEDIFELVKERTVCVSNNGSTTSFWWNPRAIESTKGSVNSLEEKELGLAGQ